MSVGYRLMYRLGITPWENHDVPAPLVELVEGRAALPPGIALDVGCGTGRDAVYLATHGWQVTGVDVVERPLDTARRRAADSGVEVTWAHADICLGTDLRAANTLLLDSGCFHGLSASQRPRAAAALTRLAAPGATLLMFAFAPGRRGPAPGGVDAERLRGHFPEWTLMSTEPATDVTLPGPLRNADPVWFRLVRS